MKKLLVFAAIAALVIPSCNNRADVDLGGNDGPKPQIEKAKNSDNAKKITLKSGAATEKGYKEIEFTDGGRYIITRTITKAEETEVLTGKYTIQDLVYILENFGTVSMNTTTGDVTIEVQQEDGTKETITAVYQEEEKLPETDFSRDIAHTWKIDKVDISVVADGKTVGFVKTGCNLEEIGKELVAQAKSLGAEVNVDVDKLKGYNVLFLTLTSSQTFMVEFSGADTFKGKMEGVVGYKFNYTLQNGTGNELLNASAECEFIPQTTTTAWLTVKVKSGDSFSGRVIFQMTVAD